MILMWKLFTVNVYRVIFYARNWVAVAYTLACFLRKLGKREIYTNLWEAIRFHCVSILIDRLPYPRLSHGNENPGLVTCGETCLGAKFHTPDIPQSEAKIHAALQPREGGGMGALVEERKTGPAADLSLPELVGPV